MEIIFDLPQAASAARALFAHFKNKKFWAFNAPMGAGKTTFINMLCQQVLQVEDTPSSPTFSIINEYKSPQFGRIMHMDWYRLRDEEEAIQAGVEEALYACDYCFIEWPEKAESLLPADRLQVTIEVIDSLTRKIIAE